MKNKKNKIVALALLGVGALTLLIGIDGTPFIFTCIMSIPLFFAKRNWIY